MKKFFAPQILKSGIIIFSALFFVTGGSYSAWTSQVKITGNTFETGAIEISVTPTSAAFNANNMAPGAWNEKNIIVKNSGTLDYDYSIHAELLDENENALKLFDALWTEIYDDADNLIDENWLSQLHTPSRSLESSDSETLKIKIKLDDDVDNSYQDLAASFNLVFDATQGLSEEVGGNVVINEIAWMGTKADPDHEWIELYNASNSDISLDGWKIQDKTDEYALQGTILPGKYYLIERNEQVTDVAADRIIEELRLSNSGEQLLLINDDDETVDIANGLKEDGNPEAWFAGKNDENSTEEDEARTMERINPLGDGTSKANWADNDGDPKNGLDALGDPIFGTPRQKNSVSE